MNKRIVVIPVLMIFLILGVSLVSAGENRNFRAHLSAGNEVPPPGVTVDSTAQGEAIFHLSKDGSTLHYKLIVANIDNVFMAHIHLAPAGQNGSIVVWLYPGAPPAVPIPGRTDGVLAEGDITASNLMGPLAGHSLNDLIAALQNGNAYVNVHTNQYPSGEVRGQIG